MIRQRRRKTVDKVPLSTRDETPEIDASSLDSEAVAPRWKNVYQPAPIVEQSIVLAAGLAIVALAYLWPPLLLLVAYLASKIVPYSFRTNDEGSSRRKLYREFCNEAEDLPERFANIRDYVNYTEGYWVNRRGMLLGTATMTPKDGNVRAVVCFCHGYTDHASFVNLVENQRLVEAGIAFCALEYEGHGRSDGPMGLIADWDRLIDDTTDYFTEIAEQYPNTPVFLFGESMGGAVAYCTYQRMAHLLRGVLLGFPMCKISDDMLPSQWVIDLLVWLIGPSGTAGWLGYLPIAPAQQSLDDVSQRDPLKRLMSSRDPLSFSRNPRLATARELIDVTKRISDSLETFDAPLFVFHGLADKVTDPQLSQLLYDESPSDDKTIRLYEGMWHNLTTGEPDENIDRVYGDIISWIQERI